MRTLPIFVSSLAAAGMIAGAGAQTVSLNAVYSCNNDRTKVRVTGCTGTGDTDLCGVQHLNAAGTAEISPKTSEYYKPLSATLQSCRLEPKTPPASAKTAAPSEPASSRPSPPAAAPSAAQSPTQQTGGSKAGKTVPSTSVPAAPIAQTSSLQPGAAYQCGAGQSLKVIACSGSKNEDLCDVQLYNGGQPNQRRKSPYGSLVAMIQVCQMQTASEAQSQAGGGAARADANGFKIGDTVQINTAFGWVDARILSMNGNNYRVHAATGVDVTKTYPNELHRIGAPTAGDRANGLYQVHDRVQVNFEGHWVESEVVVILGMEYQVKVPGDRVVWTTPQNLRPSTAPVAAAPKAGQPPKPGMTSCAGKIEGRYVGPNFSGLTVTFRSGKATATGIPEDVVYECWIGAGKIYLHQPGGPNSDIELDINNDGTLESPMGELKKKGN